MAKKINKMSTKQLITAAQRHIASGDTTSTRFQQINAALPKIYRIR